MSSNEDPIKPKKNKLKKKKRQEHQLQAGKWNLESRKAPAVGTLKKKEAKLEVKKS